MLEAGRATQDQNRGRQVAKQAGVTVGIWSVSIREGRGDLFEVLVFTHRGSLPLPLGGLSDPTLDLTGAQVVELLLRLQRVTLRESAIRVGREIAGL